MSDGGDRYISGGSFSMPEKIPRAISEATINLFGVDLIVVQLDNGQRVIEGESLVRFVDAMMDDSLELTEEYAIKLAKVIRGLPETEET